MQADNMRRTPEEQVRLEYIQYHLHDEGCINRDSEEDVLVTSSFPIISRYTHITHCVRSHSTLDYEKVQSEPELSF